MLPLRRHISSETGLSGKEIEDMVVVNSLIDEMWLLPRETAIRKLEPKIGECLLGIEFLLDRWVLGVYADGFLNIWDLAAGEQGCIWNHARMEREKCSSYVANFDSETLRVTLGMMTIATAPIRQAAMIYEIQLSDMGPPVFNILCTFPISSSSIIRQLDLSRRFVILSRQCTVNILRWNDDCDVVLEQDTNSIRTHLEELEEMYTTIHALKVIDPYLFVLKTRSVELHPLPQGLLLESCRTISFPVLRHQFRTYNFRAFYLTDIETREDSYVLKFLASDVIQGLFLFRAIVTIPSDDQNDPTLTVETLYVYPMAPGIPVRRSGPSPDKAALVADAGPQERLVHNTGHVRSPFFISACALGPQGKRGVWIERRRGVMDKNIVACRFTPETLQRDNADSEDPDLPILLAGQIVHTLRSYDLNEDLMHCVFGEVGGCILLGNRSGHVLVLDIGA
ncbi:hypothetical protein PM082_010244 [Marasmius tenuissimus]|nr:hypothetical protein PM082_010244 [Marasmius tenuissimus]